MPKWPPMPPSRWQTPLSTFLDLFFHEAHVVGAKCFVPCSMSAAVIAAGYNAATSAT